MNQAAKATEPSMEEILASIRRIISDDDPAKPAAAAPKPATAAEPPRPVAVSPRPAPAPLQRDPKPQRDDSMAQLHVPPPPLPAAALPADPDILDLTEEMAAAPPPAAPSVPPPSPSFRTIDAQPDVIFSEMADAGMEEGPEIERVEYETAPPERSPLLSSSASLAVDSAFNQLAQTVFTQNGRTVEDLVREMLRPMLKTWLDDNLPGLVERLVRAEIERVSRGRR